MIIHFKAGGELRLRLQPDVDEFTRRVEAQDGQSLREILAAIGLDPALVAFALLNGQLKRLSYVPVDGDVITLQPPVSGG
jgi:molybdopterin converting factor small subunit